VAANNLRPKVTAVPVFVCVAHISTVVFSLLCAQMLPKRSIITSTRMHCPLFTLLRSTALPFSRDQVELNLTEFVSQSKLQHQSRRYIAKQQMCTQQASGMLQALETCQL